MAPKTAFNDKNSFIVFTIYFRFNKHFNQSLLSTHRADFKVCNLKSFTVDNVISTLHEKLV